MLPTLLRPFLTAILSISGLFLAHGPLTAAGMQPVIQPVAQAQGVAPTGWRYTPQGWRRDETRWQPPDSARLLSSDEDFFVTASGMEASDAYRLNHWLIRDIAREPVWARRSLVWLRNLHPLSVSALLVLSAMVIAECSQMRRRELE